MAVNPEQMDYAESPRLSQLKDIVWDSTAVGSTISNIINDKSIGVEEARRRIQTEELNRAHLLLRLLEGRKEDVDLTVTLYRLPGEVFHHESRNEIVASLMDGNKEYGRAKARLLYVARAAKGTEQNLSADLEQVVEDVIRPDETAVGDLFAHAKRLFMEARTSERLWGKSENESEEQQLFETTRDQVVRNAITARRHIPNLRALIPIDRFKGNITGEEMMCLRFLTRPDSEDESNRVYVPWAADLDEEIMASGGYNSHPRYLKFDS